MSSENCERKLRILELFAGIGGLHWALKVAEIPCEVVAAMEINPTVLEIYTHNFKETNVVKKNLEGLTGKEINDLGVDAIVMSPPCQPFCRMGNRKDVEDNRTGPLSHITNILQDVKFRYIFVENVQGFEESTARDRLLTVLRDLNFTFQEFMLTPKTVGVPNSRLRYYLIGKQKDLPWSFIPNENLLLSEIPNWNEEDSSLAKMKSKYQSEVFSRREHCKHKRSRLENISFCVEDILDCDMSNDELEMFKIPSSVLEKYYQAMDIVTPFSTNTCCFTKGYGKYIKGTGSVLKLPEEEGKNDTNFPSLRYFTPKEISRLMSYPESFQLPSHLSRGQMYRSLGNSVNVYVVALLFNLLFNE